eukprot:CAMPEP_0194251480 /NCGR_PEP_ID=MMETSP0158-20130606/25485_1 /TAXON_ID=33649 /ORGANISM="Thalassionema nitzschioides, Strain L26-B" /LENGTH=337 /DNA_ID=CAMNT_0038988627 /DNA_START=66 /DNA_END=1075 /DNA_ORIENTATION=+
MRLNVVARHLLCLALASEAFQLRSTANFRPLYRSSNSWKERNRGRYIKAVETSMEDIDTEPPHLDITETIETTPTESNKYPPTPTFQECFSFALPAFGIYVCPPLMSLIDAAFIGRTSSIQLAALGPASAISDSAALPLLFLSIASTNLIAKSFAEKDQTASARISRTALGMGSIGGLVIATLLVVMANPISVLYCGGSTASSAMVEACTKYVAIRALALPFVVIATIAQAICIGTKDTKTPMLSVLLAGACNLFGDFILVKRLGQGIAGAAWATSASQIIAAGLLLRHLKNRGFLKKETLNKQKKEQANDQTTTISTVKQLLAFIPFLYVMAVKIG